MLGEPVSAVEFVLAVPVSKILYRIGGRHHVLSNEPMGSNEVS